LDATNPASYPGTGTTWFDLSGNASNGALTGPITFDSTNKALNFPGGSPNTAAVALPGNFANFTNGITVEFEGHFGSIARVWERIFDFATVRAGIGTNAVFVSRLEGYNELTIEMYDGNVSGGICYTATDNTAIAGNNTFQKWLITVDNATPPLCRIYRNGVELPTRTGGTTGDALGVGARASAGASVSGSPYRLPSINPRTSAFVGRSNFNGDHDLEGAIRYIRLFNQALTPAQVLAVSTATVTFDANGGVGTMTSQSSTVSATLPRNTFGRGFHEFTGWNTAANGSGVAYADGASYPFSSNTTLYAQWRLLPGSLPEPLTTIPVPTTTVPAPPPTVTEPPLPPVTTPEPVAGLDGVLRELAAGETLVTEAGEEVAVEVVADTPDALAVEGDDFALRVEGSPGGSTIALEPGGTVRVSGFGFQPASQVDVWLFSDPTYLGALTVAADGTFDGTLPVPALSDGEHTLQANGISNDGQVRSANVGVVVRSTAVSDPVTDPVTDTLPATGTSSGSTLAVVVALLALGTLTLVARRRRDFQNV